MLYLYHPCDLYWFYQNGLSRHPLYNKLKAMINRCYNQNYAKYHRYGGRGIIVCDEWLDKRYGYLNFYNWSIFHGYRDGLQIDRINNDGNYTKDNCRFVTSKVNNNNKSNNRCITVFNQTYSKAVWSDKLNIKIDTITKRLKRGYKDIQALELDTYEALISDQIYNSFAVKS